MNYIKKQALEADDTTEKMCYSPEQNGYLQKKSL